MNKQIREKGLTLIELIVVLVILAILATVAVSMVEPRVDQKRFELTQKLVTDVQDAIYQQKTNVDGTVFESGFVVDMGGLPRAFDESGGLGEVLSLRQLFQNVSVSGTIPASFSVRNANATGVTNSTDSDSQAVNNDSEVSLGTGWRGPYLKLPIGANELLDAWGSSMQSFPAAGSYSHLRQPNPNPLDPTNDLPVIAEGNPIIGIRSLGKDDEEDNGDETTYNLDLPSAGGMQLTSSQLFGTISGNVLIPESENATSTEVVVQVYYPDSVTGLIRIEKATVQGPGTSSRDGFDEFTFEFENASGDDVTFPVGGRAIRAYYNKDSDTGDFSDGTNDPDKSSIRYMNIQPGVNNFSDIMINVN